MKKFNKTISKVLAVLLLVSTMVSLLPEPVHAANTKIRQEINILDGYLGSPAGSFATSSEIINIEPTKYSNATFYFEVVASTSASISTQFFLRNATSGEPISTITIPTGTTAYTRFRSAAFTPQTGSTDYVAVVASTTGATKGLIAARVIVLQDASSLDLTQTQIEIGNNENYTSTATSSLASPKYWYYDSTKWSGTPTFYAEVTYGRLIDTYVGSSTTYSTSGTRTQVIPSNVASTTIVELWGGGGGGGAASTNTTGSGSGGAGGQYAKKTIASLAGTSKTVVVGAFGPGGVSTAGGTAGGDSTWDTNVVVAKGGGGGGANSGTAGAGSTTGGVGDTVRAGGNGAAGASGGTSGGGGGGAGSTATGGNATGGTAGTGSSVGGGNGGTGQSTNGTPAAASNAGGGGAGGRSTGSPNVDGGAGGVGRATITFNLYQSATTTIALQEDDGSFGGWTDKVYIVSAGTASSSSRVRSSSFTPTTGRNYRIVVKEGYSGATHQIYNAKIIVDQSETGITKLEPQYLVANTKLAAGTSLQNFRTYWDPAEWAANTSITYLHELDSVSAGTSDAKLQQRPANTDITNSAVTDIIERERSSSMTMPVSATDLDVIATTNNNDIYASSIIVQVDNSSPPTVTTQSASSITATDATLNGNITALGGSSATVRGFAYSTNSALSTGVSTTTENGTFSTGAFTGSATSLTCNTTYYSRAYATNSSGTGYGTIVSFVTSACPTTTLGDGTDPANITIGPTSNAIMDSYDTSNNDSNWTLEGTVNKKKIAHSFTNTATGTVTQVNFYLAKSGAPTGNAVAKIYASTGTYGGADNLPGSTVLATSDNLDVSTLTGSYALTPLTFSGANQITLLGNTKYFVSIEYTGGDTSNYVGVGRDTTSSTHAGSDAHMDAVSSSWSNDSSFDSVFNIYTSTTAADLDHFTLTTNSGIDAVSALTVTLGPSGAYNNIARVEIHDTNNNGIVYCSTTTITSNTINLSSCGLSATTGGTEWRVIIIPNSHANMTAPASGASYNTTGTVTSITASNTTAGTDTDSATITVDNASPSDVSAAVATGGDTQVSLSWLNPGDSDLSKIMVVASTSAITFTPTEGTTYSTSTLNGASRVACYGLQTSCTDSSLSNGTTYYYKIFALDSRGNWSIGVGTTPSFVTPNATAFDQSYYRIFASSTPSDGSGWTSRTSAENNSWFNVTYGNGLFVAVATDGTNRVMTSADGITWTARTAAEANSWRAVTYGNGLFVAVAFDGTNRVMTSPDGITWTARTAATQSSWTDVTYGNGLFVAVSTTAGVGNQVMTSPDGITWTSANSSADRQWVSVTYGNGKFVAVATSGGADRVMTSANGTSWQTQNASEVNFWREVVYGNGTFVAVSEDGTHRVMTSSDGVTWTNQTAAEANGWYSIAFGNGTFVAVSQDGTNRVMKSTDGSSWTAVGAAAANDWRSVTYGNGIFVAVSVSGTNNRAMTSGGSLGMPFAAQNTAATLSATGESFRLKQLIGVSNATAAIGARRFKLQYAQKSGTCDTSFSGESYADITNSTPISFDNNYREADGMTFTATTTDPDNSRTIYRQSLEADNSITTNAEIPSGSDGMFDFYLRDNGAPSGTSYCIRMVRADGGGSLDTNFGNSGVVASSSSFARGIATDGTYLYYAGYDLASDWIIEKRLISNGAVDTGFGTNGIVTGDSASQYVLGMAADSSYMYVAGTNESGDWRVEKRLLSTGAVDNNFGTSGVADSASASIMAFAITIDGTYMYVVGSQTGTGAGDWRIEKRSLSTGALDNNFGVSGVVSGSAGSYEAQAVTTDDTYIYISGRTDAGAGQIEKRLKSDGSLVAGFGSSGVVSAGNFQEAYGIATDTDYIYVVGYNSSQNWKIEKRLASDGSLCTAAVCGTEFGSSGVVSPDTTTYTANELTIGPSYMFVTGRKDGNGWWTEKRLLSTGALDTTFGSSGIIDRGGNSQFVEGIINDGLYIYEAGRDAAGPTFRAEKITAASGNLDSYTYIPEIITATQGAAISQLHYRWKSDYSSEASTAFLTTEDTPLNTTDLDIGDRLRLRFLIKDTQGSATNYTYRLETASSSCTTWYQVASSTTGGSPHWVMDTSTRVSNGDATSNNSGLTDPTGNFVAGYVMTQDSQTPALSLTSGQFTELSFSMRSTNALSRGTTYCFRLTNGGVTTGFTYSQQPQIVIPPAIIKKPGGGGGNAGGEGNGSGPIIPGGGAGGGGGSTGGSGGGGSQGGGGSGGGGGDTGMLLLNRFFAIGPRTFILTNDKFTFGYLIKLR